MSRYLWLILLRLQLFGSRTSGTLLIASASLHPKGLSIKSDENDVCRDFCASPSKLESKCPLLKTRNRRRRNRKGSLALLQLLRSRSNALTSNVVDISKYRIFSSS